jgi:transketolase
MAHVSHKVNGVEFSTGSLGHGLSYSVGIALGLKIKNLKNKVFVILGDGEVAEGSNWEAILFAHHHKLKNLNIIVDQNNLQSLTTVNETLKIDPIEKKFESFGLNVFSCDGHCHKSLFEKLNFMMKNKTDYPNVLIAKTIKGKGVDFMENQISWHYKSPNEIELKNSINQLKNA